MQIKIEPVKSSEVNALANISIKCFYDTFYGQNREEDMMLFLEENFNTNTLAAKCYINTTNQHIFKVGNDAQTDWLMKKELSK